MLKPPSLKSSSTPSERYQSESYIQCYSQTIRRKQQTVNNSFFEEDQMEQEEQQIPQQYEEYIKKITGMIMKIPQSPYLCKYYVSSMENEQLTLISETLPETLMDHMKIRLQNNVIINEDEIIVLAFELLNGIKELQNLIYLSPSYIIKQWKIINYMENMLKQDNHNWLEQEDRLYLAPELEKYFEIELNDCDDFNAHIFQNIVAPKAVVYSLGIIILQCMHLELKKENNLLLILQNAKYSWSLRDLVKQMILEETQRPSIEQLLQNPLFHNLQLKTNNHKPQSQMSLFLFLNLVKSGYQNVDWADQFFTIEEIISISDLKEGLYPIGELKSEINQQIQQIISHCQLNCSMEDLINEIAKIARVEDPKQQQVSSDQPIQKQFLFKKWFQKKPKQPINADLQEIVIQTSEPNEMAQLLLLKLLSTASEKAFRLFMIKYIKYMGHGLVWQNLRKICWARALGFESIVAHREIVQLTLEVCEYLNESKQKDIIQIEKDLNRQKYTPKMIEKIKITLKGFINQKNSYCYIQGMETITSVFLEAFNYDTELATICLAELYNKKIIKIPADSNWNDQLLKDTFNQNLQEKILLYKWLLNYLDPNLYSYLREQDFKSETYVVSWFTNFFSREFPIEGAIKIYDYLLIVEENFEILLAGAIMLELKGTFQIKDSEGILGCLKNLANNVSLEQCLETASKFSLEIQKNLFTLTHQDEAVCNQMKSENEYLQERPWDHPYTWNQIQEKQIFEMTIFDLQTMLKDSKSFQKIIPLDMRSSKDYEKACIYNSIFAGYVNKKINAQLINYFELRGQIEEDQIYYIVIVYDYETQDEREIVDYLLKLGIRKLCLLKGGIHAALMDGLEVIKQKVKAVLPPWIKTQIEEMKKKI